MKRTISFFFLVMLTGGGLLYAYQQSKVLVLKTGQTIAIDGDYSIEGQNVYFKLGDGNTTLLPLNKIDMPATEARNQAIAAGKTSAKETIQKNQNFREVKGRNYQGLSTVASPDPEAQTDTGGYDSGGGNGNGNSGTKRRRGVDEDGIVSTDYLRRAFRDAPPSMQPTLQQIERRFESRFFSVVLIFCALVFFMCSLINLGFYFYLMAIAVMNRWFWGMLMITGMLVGLTAYLGWWIGTLANLAVFLLAFGYILVECPGRRFQFLFLLLLPIISSIFCAFVLALAMMVTG